MIIKEGKAIMANLKITVLNDKGQVKQEVCGQDQIVMVSKEEYQPGDQLQFETDETSTFYMIRIDGAMDEAYVYLTEKTLNYVIPFDMDKISYHPASFSGEYYYITMRKAKVQENRNYRNVAQNAMDQNNHQGCFPHVHANAETKGNIHALFAARNVIDGIVANESHWPWPYQSWGIDQREDAEITLEFGRPVDMDELRLYTRADFPHDNWWVQATVIFSDGSEEILEMEKSMKPHVFSIKKEGITWLKLCKLIKADDPSPFPALTQIEVYGRNSE